MFPCILPLCNIVVVAQNHRYTIKTLFIVYLLISNANNKAQYNGNQRLLLPKNILRLRSNLVFIFEPQITRDDKLDLHMHTALLTVIDLYTNTVLFSGYLKARL